LYHHENYDGSGYPCQIKGNSIPIEARIIRLVDSFDAMTSNRPYRAGLPPAKALNELLQLSGSYYDPALVHSFAELYQEGLLGFNSAQTNHTSL